MKENVEAVKHEAFLTTAQLSQCSSAVSLNGNFCWFFFFSLCWGFLNIFQLVQRYMLMLLPDLAVYLLYVSVCIWGTRSGCSSPQQWLVAGKEFKGQEIPRISEILRWLLGSSIQTTERSADKVSQSVSGQWTYSMDLLNTGKHITHENKVQMYLQHWLIGYNGIL